MKMLCTAVTLTIPLAAFAGDLEQRHPLRKTLVEVIRSSNEYSYLKGTKFRIKRIWASDEWAYLCGFVVEQNGAIERTDGQPDLYQIILKKKDSKWLPVANLNGPVAEGGKAECSLAAGGWVSAAALQVLAEEQQKQFGRRKGT
jgi:hypothetical protein